MTSYDVIVIGGGAAGMTAAVHLEAAACRVLLIEARSRLGGRICSQSLGEGQYLELGAQFVAQSGQNRLRALLARQGFPLYDVIRDGRAVRLDRGQRILHRPVASGLSWWAELDLGRLALLASWRLRALAGSSAEAMAAADRMSLRQYLQDVAWNQEAHRFLANTFEQGLCIDLDSVSLYEGLATLATIGSLKNLAGADRYYVTQGLQNAFSAWLERSKVEQVLGQPVLRIEQDAVQVRVFTESATYTARRAIITVPAPLYRQIGFEPPLRADLASLAQTIVRGSAVKVLACYADPWWRAEGFSGLVTGATEPYDFIVDTSFEPQGPGVLVGLVTGPRADRLLLQSDSEKQTLFTLQVQQAFGRHVPCQGFYHLDWTREAYSLGAYAAHRALGTWTSTQKCFTPFGRLHFAGTETADAWRGYIEGAMQSGEREAQSILQALSAEH